MSGLRISAHGVLFRVVTLEKVFAKFPGASGFMEITDDSARLGARGVVIADGVAWLVEEDGSSRPISPSELEERGAFTCKPEDFGELVRKTLS